MENKTKTLGKLVAVHRSSRLSWREFFVFAGLGFLIVLLPLSYGFYRYIFGYTQYGPAAASTWSLPWYLGSLIGLFIFTFLTLRVFSRSRQYVAIHKNGVRIRTHKSLNLTWDQIQGLSYSTIQPNFLNIVLKPRPQAYLFLDSITRIRIENIEKFNALVARLRNTLFPRLHARTQELFSSGNWVEFGPITIHPDGLRVQYHEMPWQDIHRMSVVSGYLVVESANRAPFKIAVIEIPNLEIMLQIAQAGLRE